MTPPLTLRAAADGEIAEARLWYEEKRAGLGQEFLAAVRTTLRAIEEIRHLLRFSPP